MMITNRLVILATVETVRNHNGHSYLSCSRCFSKVLYDTESAKWTCMKCRSDREKPVLRYRLNFQIADSTRICDITVFGQNLNKFFGCTADEFDRHVREFSESRPEVFADESVAAAVISETFVGHNFLFGFKVPSVRRDRGRPASLDMIGPQGGGGGGADGRKSSVIAWQMLFPSNDHSFTTVMARFHCFVGNVDSNRSAVKNKESYEDSFSNLSAVDVASRSAYGWRGPDRGRLTDCSLQSFALSCDQRMESSGKKVSVVRLTYDSGNTMWWNSLESPDRGSHSPFILAGLDSRCCGLKVINGLATGNVISGGSTKFTRKRVSCVSCTSAVDLRTSLHRRSVKRCALEQDGSLSAVNFPLFQERTTAGAGTQKRLDFLKQSFVNSELADIGSKVGGGDNELEMPYSEDLDEFLAKGEFKEGGRSLLDIRPGLTVCLDVMRFTDCGVSPAANEVQRKCLDCSVKARLGSKDSSAELFPDLSDDSIERLVERSQELRANPIGCHLTEMIQTSRSEFAASGAGNASPEINFSPVSNRASSDSLVPNFAAGSDLTAKIGVRLNCRHENFSCFTPVNVAKVFLQKKVCDGMFRSSATWKAKPLSVLRSSENLRTTLGRMPTSRRNASKKLLDEKSFDLFPSPHVFDLNLSRKDAVHSCSTPVLKFPASSTPLSRLRGLKDFEKECDHNSASEILGSSDCILQTPIENFSRVTKDYKACRNKRYGKIRLPNAGSCESCEHIFISGRCRKSTNLCSQDLFSDSPCNQISNKISSSVFCETARHPPIPIPYSTFDNKPLKCSSDNSQALGDSEELFSNSDDLFAD